MLTIEHLTKQFGKKTLFRDLCLTVEGPAVLWAPSGWGKTTLLRILMGLEASTSGSVEGVGRVGAVFQEDRLCPQLTPEENVALVLPVEQYKAKTQYKEQIRKDLIQLGLDDEALALPARKLSGGQKQRAAVARALITDPQLILADEPTGALDSRSSDALLELFGELNGTGQTILMVTHSVKAASHAGRVLFLRDGQVYHQLYRGGESQEAQFRRISDTLTVLAGGGEPHA